MTTQRVDIGFKPRDWQRACFRGLSRKRFGVLVVHRRGGKTVMAVMRLIDAALKCQREQGRYAYIAPLFKQAKDVAWSYLKGYALKVPGSRVNESECWVELPNHAGSVSRIRIYGADNPDSLRGIYLDGAVMDEVADMKPDVWDQVVLPTLTDRQGWALFIGTPKGVNRFSDLYDQAQRDDDWFAALYTVLETGALPESEIELARKSMPENAFRQEYLCDFAAANENALIPLTLAMTARGKHLPETAYTHAPKILGVDVARQGGDRSAIIRRQGLASWTPVTLQSNDSMAVASRVAQEIQLWKPDAVFVDGTGGYGAGVIDRLRQLGYTPIEVQFGGKANDPRFLNKRAEMWWLTKEWLEQGGALPDVMELVRELSAPMYEFDRTRGVFKLEPKEDIKERIGVSPDLADALCLTFAQPVAPAWSIQASRDMPGNARAVIDYSPFG